MAEYVCLIVPAIDADTGVIQADLIRRERVVRCRDCVDHFSHNGSMVCGNFSNPDDGYYVVVQPDGLCAWGEPREGE